MIVPENGTCPDNYVRCQNENWNESDLTGFETCAISMEECPITSIDLISIHQMEKPGYVYSLIEVDQGDHFMIGYSKNPTNLPLV